MLSVDQGYGSRLLHLANKATLLFYVDESVSNSDREYSLLFGPGGRLAEMSCLTFGEA